MSAWPSVRIVLAIVSISLAGSACGGAPAGTVSPTGTTPAVVATTASTTQVPSPPATRAPTAPPSWTASSAEPPAATLAAEGGDPVAGRLGSYTWAGGGSDSPWLPGAPLTAAPGEPLTIAIADGVAIVGWTARQVPAGTTNGTGAVGLGAGGPPATFAVPGRGRWTVQVAVGFADGLGSATYYWDLTVR